MCMCVKIPFGDSHKAISILKKKKLVKGNVKDGIFIIKMAKESLL